jgi:hypothetical protein
MGYVYIATNEELKVKNIYKIGLTEDVEDRLEGLNNTSVLYDFEICAQFKVDSARDLEKRLHKYFDIKRVRKNREFFQVDLDEIITKTKEYIEYEQTHDHYHDKKYYHNADDALPVCPITLRECHENGSDEKYILYKNIINDKFEYRVYFNHTKTLEQEQVFFDLSSGKYALVADRKHKITYILECLSNMVIYKFPKYVKISRATLDQTEIIMNNRNTRISNEEIGLIEIKNVLPQPDPKVIAAEDFIRNKTSFTYDDVKSFVTSQYWGHMGKMQLNKKLHELYVIFKKNGWNKYTRKINGKQTVLWLRK